MGNPFLRRNSMYGTLMLKESMTCNDQILTRCGSVVNFTLMRRDDFGSGHCVQPSIQSRQMGQSDRCCSRWAAILIDRRIFTRWSRRLVMKPSPLTYLSPEIVT